MMVRGEPERPEGKDIGVSFLHSLSNAQWGIALAVPVGILLLYFLKLRRRPVEVPSTFLWRKSIEDLRVNSLWQRLRQNLLLLLQLMVAALLLLALLAPAWNVQQTGRRIILLVDQSASMSASEGASTRLDQAKAQAKGLVGQMRTGDVGMVIAFGRSARVLAPYTENQQVLQQAIDSIEATAQSTDLREALSIASALANPQQVLERPGDADVVPLELSPAAGQEATIYLFSDGKFPAVPEFSLGNLSVEYAKIGATTENVGITAISARPRVDGSDRLEVFARVKNFGRSPATADVELRVDDQRVDLRRMTLSPAQEEGIVLLALAGPVERMSLHLLTEDALAIDNVAWLVVTPPRPLRILRIGPANPLLEAVLSTPALARWAKVESLPVSEKDRDLSASTEEGRYDVVIFDRCRPARMPSCSTWFVGAVPLSSAGVPSEGEEKEVISPAILNWDSSHPALRFLQMDDVSIRRAWVLPAGPGRVPLIETDQGPILWQQMREGYNDLVLSVPLVDMEGQWQTDWPLKPSFPLLVMNVLRFLGGLDADRGRNVKVGEGVMVRDPASTAQVTLPTGQVVRATPTRPGVIEFIETDQVGLYRLETESLKETFAVNLFDESESAIEPTEFVQLGSEKSSTVEGSFSTQRELWRWLALAGLGLLVAEWYIYNKRVYL
jgi:hypothetical protein